MKLTKDFQKIKDAFPEATFHKNSSGPGTLIYLDKDKKNSGWYENKVFTTFRCIEAFTAEDFIKFMKSS